MKKFASKTLQNRPHYGGLVESITRLHVRIQAGAAAAVNQFLTLRNWMFGACIVEFEQRGSDRARYGERLFGLPFRRFGQEGNPGLQPGPVGMDASLLRCVSQVKEPAQLPPELLLRLSWSHFIELIRVVGGRSHFCDPAPEET